MTRQARRALAGVVVVASAALGAFLEAQAPPKTREGRPSLQGTWSYATLTPLERPDEFAGKAFLTAAEAAAFEQRTLNVQNRDRRDEGPAGRGTDGRTDLDRAYNQGWWEYGAKVVGTRRTSLLIDPPDGRIPPLTALGQQAAEDKRGLWTANGEYEGGSSLNFYTRRMVYILNGRSANLEYGSYFQDAPPIFLNSGDLARLWNEPARIYLFTDASKLEELGAGLPAAAHKFAESGGKLILTNR